MVQTATQLSEIETILGGDADGLLQHRCNAIPKESLHLPGPDFIDRVFAMSDRPTRTQTSLQALCATLGLRLATERLAGFAHWVTPPGPPRRYDTRFFVAVAPPEQTASHDDAEAVAHVWIRPSDALDRARGGDLRLVFATTTTMTWLAGFNSTSAVMAQARVPRSIPVHEPRAARAGDAKRVLIRSHEAYAEVCRLDPLGQGTASCELASGMQTLLAPSVRRIVAAGVNSYVVGLGDGAVVGPQAHLRRRRPGRASPLLRRTRHLLSSGWREPPRTF